MRLRFLRHERSSDYEEHQAQLYTKSQAHVFKLLHFLLPFWHKHHACYNTRNRHRKCSVRKGVLWDFAKFTGKHLCQSLLFNKAAGRRPVTLLEKKLWRSVFLWIFWNFKEHLFYRKPLGDCFCNTYSLLWQNWLMLLSVSLGIIF